MARQVSKLGRAVPTGFSYPMSKEPTINKFRKMAETKDMTFSQLVTSLIEEYVQVNEDSGPESHMAMYPDLKRKPTLRKNAAKTKQIVTGKLSMQQIQDWKYDTKLLTSFLDEAERAAMPQYG